MFKFKENAKANIGSEDAFYALTYGGYLNPYDILEDEKMAEKVNAAGDLLEKFFSACYNEEVIEEI